MRSTTLSRRAASNTELRGVQACLSVFKSVKPFHSSTCTASNLDWHIQTRTHNKHWRALRPCSAVPVEQSFLLAERSTELGKLSRQPITHRKPSSQRAQEIVDGEVRSSRSAQLGNAPWQGNCFARRRTHVGCVLACNILF